MADLEALVALSVCSAIGAGVNCSIVFRLFFLVLNLAFANRIFPLDGRIVHWIVDLLFTGFFCFLFASGETLGLLFASLLLSSSFAGPTGR